MLPSSPDDLQAFDPLQSSPAPHPGPILQAPPLGVRPAVNRFGKPAADGDEPVITPQPGQLVAPLREALRLGRLGKPGRLPLGGLLGKARA